jgi:tetratricopeptide (TPR) repeat protein
MFLKGVRLRALGEVDQAFTSYKSLSETFGEDQDPSIQRLFARAVYNMSAIKWHESDCEGAMEYCDLLIGRFADAEDRSLRESFARAMTAKAACLVGLERSDEAIATYDQVLERFSDVEDSDVRESVVLAACGRALIRGAEGKVRHTIDALDRWQRERGEFDCQAVMNDQHFNRIRRRPTFVKYLLTKGCNTEN